MGVSSIGQEQVASGKRCHVLYVGKYGNIEMQFCLKKTLFLFGEWFIVMSVVMGSFVKKILLKRLGLLGIQI